MGEQGDESDILQKAHLRSHVTITANDGGGALEKNKNIPEL